MGVQIVVEGDGGNFGGLAVIGSSFVIVGSGGAACEINSMFALPCAAGNAEARGAGMCGQFAPFNFRGILLVDLAEPAFIGGNVARAAVGAGLCTVDNDDFLVGYASGHTEGERAGKRCGLSPAIFIDV